MLKKLQQQWTLLLILFALFASFAVNAEQIKQPAVHSQELKSLYQQLLVVKQRNHITQDKYNDLFQLRHRQKRDLQAKDVEKEKINRVRLNLSIAHAELVSSEQAVSESQEKLIKVRKTIRQTRRLLEEAKVAAVDSRVGKLDIVKLQAEIVYLKSMYEVEEDRFKALQEGRNIARKIVAAEKDWHRHVQSLFDEHQNVLREEAFADLAKKTEQEQQNLLANLASLNKELRIYEATQRYDDPQAITLGVKIFQTEEQMYLSQLDLKLAEFQDHIEDVTVQQKTATHLAELDNAARHIESISDELQVVDKRLKAKYELLRQNQIILSESKAQNIMDEKGYSQNNAILLSLLGGFNKRSSIVSQYLQQVTFLQAHVGTDLAKVLAQRQGLPGLTTKAWLVLGYEIVQIPSATMAMFHSVWDHVVIGFKGMSSWLLVFLIIVELLWFLTWFFGRYFLFRIIHNLAEKRQRISSNVLYVTLQLLYRNWGALIFSVAIISIFMLCNIPFRKYQFLVYLALVWFSFRFIITAFRMSLLETMSSVSGQDVRLYYRLKHAFIFGGIVTAFTVLAHQIDVAYEVRDLSYRLFVLFVLLVSFILLRARYLIPELLDYAFEEPHPYLKKIIRLLAILIPLSLIVNAIIGLVGYVQLAWIMSYYQFVFLLVLTGYMLIRSLLKDLTEIISTMLIRHLKNGWLWSQAFLRPLDLLLRISALVAAWVILFAAYGWDRNSAVVRQLKFIINYPLVTFNAGKISILSTVEFIVLVTILFWVARWVREFTYRWLFADVKDKGVRNSFSVFTQYGTVLVGAFITLRVLGIDLGGLAYILGGLAVGIGFGLRDLANNLVSGVLLLIERPIREGDLVSIAGHEGRVTHIGMRSMTVKSWEHLEVLIPNSELFHKTFTNWTHQDSIVRTEITIRIQRCDNPERVEKIIADVLEQQKEVLDEPNPQILMKELADALIELEIRYYINLEEHIRMVVRSKVLFNIWRAFKRENIHPPYPQQTIRLLPNKDS